MDEIAAEHAADEEIVMQIGTSRYVPKHCAGFSRFFDYNEVKKYMDKCSLVVAHGGVGSVMRACLLGKRVIVVPRQKKYGEHVDDNQLEIAGVLKEKGMAQVCTDIAELDKMVSAALNEKAKDAPYKQQGSRLENYMIHYVDRLSKDGERQS